MDANQFIEDFDIKNQLLEETLLINSNKQEFELLDDESRRSSKFNDNRSKRSTMQEQPQNNLLES